LRVTAGLGEIKALANERGVGEAGGRGQVVLGHGVRVTHLLDTGNVRQPVGLVHDPEHYGCRETDAPIWQSPPRLCCYSPLLPSRLNPLKRRLQTTHLRLEGPGSCCPGPSSSGPHTAEKHRAKRSFRWRRQKEPGCKPPHNAYTHRRTPGSAPCPSPWRGARTPRRTTGTPRRKPQVQL
jgi:hypothetical protein